MIVREIVDGYMQGLLTIGDVQLLVVDIVTRQNIERVIDALPAELREPVLAWFLGDAEFPDTIMTNHGLRTIPPEAVMAVHQLRTKWQATKPS